MNLHGCFSRNLLLVTAIFALLGGCVPDKIKHYDNVVVLYMAANNNLDSYARENIAAMDNGYLPGKDDNTVLLLFKHLQGEDPVLVRIIRNGTSGSEQKIIKEYSGNSSCDPDVLKDVLNTAADEFPSDSYGLILWSHSTGWLPPGYYDTHPESLINYIDPYAGIVKSFGYDEGEEMELTDIADAIPFKLNFMIFDACFNGGIETVYEFKDKSDYIVASPTEILATGFPYDKIMDPLLKYSNLNEVCELFYQYYAFDSGYDSGTISLYNTKYAGELAEAARQIFSIYRSNIANIDLSSVQPYFRMGKHWFYDLNDMMNAIAPEGDLSAFRSALAKVVIGKWYTPSFLDINILRYSGISTYLPKPADNELDTYYERYKWNSDTGMIP